jgi:site-specific recombinase XerD
MPSSEPDNFCKPSLPEAYNAAEATMRHLDLPGEHTSDELPSSSPYSTTRRRPRKASAVCIVDVRNRATGRLIKSYPLVDKTLVGPDGKRHRLPRRIPAGADFDQWDAWARRYIDSEWKKIVFPELKEAKTWNEFWPIYLKWVRANKAPSTLARRESLQRTWLADALGDLRLNEIGSRVTDAMVGDQQDEELDSASINHSLSTVSTALKLAEEQGEIARAPRIRSLKVGEQAFQYLQEEQLDRLVYAANATRWLLRAVLLGCDAGLRLSEIRGLKRAKIDRSLRLLHVDTTIWNSIERTTKNYRMRTIELTDRLADALELGSDESDWFVAGEGEKPVSQGAIYAGIRRACESAGLEPVGWHALRHSFCTHLALKKVDIEDIRKLAGHSSIEVTAKYIHLTAATRSDAYPQPL